MNSRYKKLPPAFYDGNTKEIAALLLGKVLVRTHGSRRIAGIIVETEAYLGKDDPACHSKNGIRTGRNASMYLPGGHAYVYLIYGIHCCMNVVTGDTDRPEAVLIRAIEPIQGLPMIKKARGPQKKITAYTTGPGKLAQALSIDRNLDGISLMGDILYIEDRPSEFNKNDIERSSRIGIAKTNEAADWPLRFFIKKNPYVSRV